MNPHPMNRDERLSLQKRESWLEQAIRESQERGEFDNLPGTGKPLDLTENPHGADWESGFRVLKNAGFAPAWIEADKEIRKLTEQMEALIERTTAFIAEHSIPDAPATDCSTPARSDLGWRGKLARLWDTSRSRDAAAQPDSWDLEVFRQRARREYLQLAEELDRATVEYNGALPSDLMWKERQRRPAEQAECDFDAAIPPVRS